MRTLTELPPTAKRGKRLLLANLLSHIPPYGQWLELSLKEFCRLTESKVKTLEGTRTVLWNSQHHPRGWLRRHHIRLTVAVNSFTNRVYLQRVDGLKKP